MAGPLGYPLPDARVKLALTALTGPYNPALDFHQAIRESVLQAGIVATGGAFEQPVPLICLLEGFINAIVGDGGVRELSGFP